MISPRAAEVERVSVHHPGNALHQLLGFSARGRQQQRGRRRRRERGGGRAAEQPEVASGSRCGGRRVLPRLARHQCGWPGGLLASLPSRQGGRREQGRAAESEPHRGRAVGLAGGLESAAAYLQGCLQRGLDCLEPPIASHHVLPLPPLGPLPPPASQLRCAPLTASRSVLSVVAASPAAPLHISSRPKACWEARGTSAAGGCQ